MIITNQIKKDEVHLGINNKILKSFFVYPWRAFLTSAIIILLIIASIGGIDKVKQFAFIGLPVCIVSMFIAAIYHKNSCFKLVINSSTKEVTFHLMFTTKTVVADFDQISVEIGREIKLSVEGKNYRILSETLHDVVSYLPTNTKIIFKGFFGRQFEKELEKTNRPLTPGRLF